MKNEHKISGYDIAVHYDGDGQHDFWYTFGFGMLDRENIRCLPMGCFVIDVLDVGLLAGFAWDCCGPVFLADHTFCKEKTLALKYTLLWICP